MGVRRRVQLLGGSPLEFSATTVETPLRTGNQKWLPKSLVCDQKNHARLATAFGGKKDLKNGKSVYSFKDMHYQPVLAVTYRVANFLPKLISMPLF